jgi:HK97 family phage portal protein
MIETLGSLSGGFLPPPPFARRTDEPSQAPGSSLENPRTSWDRIFETQEGYAGKSVNEITALQLMAVWRCVNLIAGALAKCPLNVYRRVPDIGKTKATNHYLWPLLHREANDVVKLSAYRFRRLMQTWLLLWGNAYALFEENGRGQIQRFWPLRPDRMRVTGTAASLIYTYQRPDGSSYILPSAYMLHLRGLETDGIMGLSPIKAARQSLGLGLAAEEYGARYFGAGGKPGGYLEVMGKLTPVSKQNIRESFEDMHKGLHGAHRVGIFEEGMKYHEVGVPPEDMQFLQTRQFQGIDVARLFGVPPHKIAELARATFSNIEHQSMEFLQDCLADWMTNWEQELTVSCLSESESQTIFLEFSRDSIARGDKISRYTAYNIGRNGGWLSQNMILDEENLNRIEGGDTFLTPLNMQVTSTSPETDPNDDPDDPGAVEDDPNEGNEPEPNPAIAPPAPNPAVDPAKAAALKKAAQKKAQKKLSGGSDA